MLRLRPTPLQAARDMFYTNALLEAEADVQRGRNLFLELFRVPRNRRATQASCIVMFMQQFCGVNVIAYYSTTIFLQAGFSRTSALLVTMGTGLVNWIFAAPALYTSMSGLFVELVIFSDMSAVLVDTFGRRNLLLATFPLLSACLLMTGFGFWAPEGPTRTGIVATGIYVSRTYFRLRWRYLPLSSYSKCFTRRAKVRFPSLIPQKHSLCISAIWGCRWPPRSVGCSSKSTPLRV